MPEIALVALNASYSHTNLAIRYLKQIAEQFGLETVCREFTINDQESRVADELIVLNPKVLGMSCYIWNYESTLKVVEKVKLACPAMLIMLGGPQLIDCDRTWMEEHPWVDFVIVGEGEDVFRKWCCQHQRGDIDYKDIPGIWLRTSEGDIINNYVNKKARGALGVAYQKEEDLRNRLVYYEASRGCAYRCTYCLSSLDKQMGYRDLTEVKADLTRLAYSGAKTVKLVDRTFNHRESRAREIIAYWNTLPVDCCLHCEMVADIISDEFLGFLAHVPAGRLQFEIGIQSTNTRSLQAVNRRMDWQRAKQVIHALLAPGNIHIHLDLLAGLPYEDMHSFRTSFNEVYSLRPHHLQVGMLKILPGTIMKQQAAVMDYAYTSYPPYEFISNPWLTALEVVKLHHLADTIDKLHNHLDLWAAHEYLLARYPSAFDYWLELSALAWQSGMLSAPQKNDSWAFLPVKLARKQWGEAVAGQVEERVQFSLLQEARRYHFSPPFTDGGIPDTDFGLYQDRIVERWPQLKELNLKERKRRVAVHRLPSLAAGEHADGFMAFLYPPVGTPCEECFGW